MTMNQQLLAERVVAELGVIPETPAHGRYLPLERAYEIVDETIEHLRRTGGALEYTYVLGHRRRLAASLTMIPMAEKDDATCLDVGCFGYMAYWAWRYLGYAHVEGIELQPDDPRPIVTRTVEMEGTRLDIRIHNFDLGQQDWPIEERFDTILFFETLEHVDKDHSGVMLNITERMGAEATLVMSVPNSVSYKTLKEFMSGAPPWTYWFFSPDLKHEPRHCFEYTPIFFKILLRSAGLEETAFRTLCAYAEPEALRDVFEIGEALSIEPRFFGETMIAQARKVSESPLFRYPDCIYDGDRYYRTTAPLLQDVFCKARDRFFREHYGAGERLRAIEEELRSQVTAAEDRACALEMTLREAAARNDEAHDRHLAREEESRVALRALETELEEVTARGDEALFLCDRYLAQEEELRNGLSAAEERARAAGDRVSALERAEQELRGGLTAAEDKIRGLERELQEAAARSDGARQGYRAREEELRRREEEVRKKLHVAETHYDAIARSSFWRVTAPARRLANRFPRLRSHLKAILLPPARVCRAVVRRLV